MRQVAALLMLVGCGSTPERPPPTPPGDWTVPLVEAWAPTRILVLGRVGEETYLFEIDGDEPACLLDAAVVGALGIPVRGDPLRGRLRGEMPMLLLGNRVVTNLPFHVAPEGSLGEHHEVPIAGVLGGPLVEETRLNLAGHLDRFADLPRCGRSLAPCFPGAVARVEPGKVRLRFARPNAVLPAPYWLRFDFGRIATPRTVLIRLVPSAGRSGPIDVVIGGDDLSSELVRAPGEPLTLVDVASLGLPCPAEVCWRR